MLTLQVGCWPTGWSATCWTELRLWSWVTKSISCSTVGQQRPLQVVPGLHPAQDHLPGGGDVGLVAVRPAQRGADAVLPVGAARDLRPGRQAQPARLHRLPDVDVRVAEHQHVLPAGPAADLVGDPGLLAAGHQVVDQHAEPAPAVRGELGDDARQVVDAAQVLDHHADVPQVVAPDLLDQLGVVPALDVDPAGQRGLGPLRRYRGPSPTPYGWARRRAPRAGAFSSTGLALVAATRRRAGSCGACRGGPPGPPGPVSQRITAPQKPVVGVLEHQPGRQHVLGAGRSSRPLPARGQDVLRVAVGRHASQRRGVTSAVPGIPRRAVAGGWLECARPCRCSRSGSVLFPHMPLRLRVFEQRYLVMLAELVETDAAQFGVVLIERGCEVGGGEQRFGVGTVAEITQLGAQEGFVGLVAQGGRRFGVERWLADAPHPWAEVGELPDLVWDPGLAELRESTERLVRRTLAVASEFAENLWPADIELSDDPVAAAWQLAAVAPLGRAGPGRAARSVEHGRVARRPARADQGCGGWLQLSRNPKQVSGASCAACPDSRPRCPASS